MRLLLKNVFCAGLAGAAFMAGSAAIAGYDNPAWPVRQISEGIYEFTPEGKADAVNFCTGYYTADVISREEHASNETAFGSIVKAHSVHMRDAFAGRFTGDQARRDQLTKDLTWHFANAAQYEAYQDFRDGSEQVCEGYALENGLIDQSYMDDFFARLTG
jgi:hypothetical protein